jgi:succinoglycan biosynthesis protein ExoH
MLIKKEISDRIEMLRFLMIFGVVILHVPQYVPLEAMGGSWFDYVKAFCQHALFRATVPVLTLISGYLLFSSTLYLAPLKLWKKKLRSLALPFLIFNLSVLCVAYVAQSRLGLTMSYDLLKADAGTWLDAMFGLTNSPVNYPLNFLRDMMVLMLLAPLFGLLLRTSPLPGFILVTLFFYNNFEGTLVLRDTMAILFYAGGMAATQKWNLEALDKYAKPILVLFLGLCALIIQMKIANRTQFVLVAPFLVWPAASLLVGTRVGIWAARHAKYSFFVFITHAPVLMVSWALYGKVASYIPYPVYWIATPFVTVGALMLVYKLGMRMAPAAFGMLTGARTRKAAVFVERRKSPRPAGAPVYSPEVRVRLASS